jgi:hypothetical protein
VEKKLLKAEKTIKKIIRKVFKNSLIDYSVQVTVSSLEPNKIKYGVFISSPSRHVQDVTFMFDSFEELDKTLQECLKEWNYAEIQKTDLQSRANSFRSRADDIEARIKDIDKYGLDKDGFLNKPEKESAE